MAQWNHEQRTLHAKLVYYGPPLGGKTATVEALHALLDPAGTTSLVSIGNAEQRTLLFDLLRLDAGELGGYRLTLGIFGVPGAVPLDTTRRLVLAGADAVVFVADSRASRREQNVWSLQNLRLNLRLQGLEAQALPVVFQFNKQDLGDAVGADQMAAWLGVEAGRGFAAAAREARGVLEPLAAALAEWIAREISSTAAAAAGIGGLDPSREVARMLAARPAGARSGRGKHSAAERVTLAGDDPLECAVRASLELAGRLSERPARDTAAPAAAVGAGARAGR